MVSSTKVVIPLLRKGEKWTVETGVMSDRPLWVHPSPICFSVRSRTIRQWLEDCDSSHPSCLRGIEITRHPRRLLYVGSDEQTELRLVDLDESFMREPKRYIALSHCWGTETIPCSTTGNRLKDHLAAIEIGTLPKTFSDAVEITRTLGIPYIWIDSLCIVQDDVKDWETEAAKMADIFYGAYLVIMPAMAKDCHGGFGLSDVPPAMHFDIPSTTSSERPRIFLRDPEESGQYIVKILGQSPLLARGWVFQETILAHRVVHFVNGQFFWQCRTVFESEDATVHNSVQPTKYGSAHPLININLLDTSNSTVWQNLIRDHSFRDLTWESDDLPSLRGITDFYQHFTAGQCMVGLWQADLAVQLAWNTDNCYKGLQESDRNKSLPTWSWASVRHSLRRRLVFESPIRDWGNFRRDIVWKASFVFADIQWESLPMVSALKHAVLSFQRFQMPWEDLVGRWNESIPGLKNKDGSNVSKARSHWIHDDSKERAAYYHRCYELKVMESIDENCLLPLFLASTEDRRDGKYAAAFKLRCLIIEAWEGKHRRVGTVEFDWDVGPDMMKEALDWLLSRTKFEGSIDLI